MRLSIHLIILAAFSVIMLIIGVRGMFIKRPIVYSARIHYWYIVMGFSPMMISAVELMFNSPDGSFDIAGLFPGAILGATLIFSWWQLR